MNQGAKRQIKGRTGWSEKETKSLWQEVRAIREQGLPLKNAFDNMARITGRKSNSIRNYYYAKAREGDLDTFGETCAFTPFSQEEIVQLVKTVLAAQAQGMSVRGITMRMGEGDKKAMLRYQNKYRSMVKNNPEAVRFIIGQMQAEGQAVFDPYHQQRPHRSGRKPNEKRRQDMDAALSELGAGLKRV